MKRKDLKEKIRQAAVSEMPDVINNIRLDNIRIEPKVNETISWRKSFKWAVSAFTVLLAAIFTFQLFLNQSSALNFQTDVELLAFQTVSAQSLLEYNDAEMTELSLEPLSQIALSDSEANETSEYLDDMTPMIELAELLIHQNEQIDYEELESDRESYQKHVQFSADNLLGETIEFSIYYNELKNSIEGMIVQSENSYEFNQNKDRLRLYVDGDAYIDSEYQVIDGNHDFRFRFMRQESELFSTNIKIPTENAEKRADFEFINNKGKVIRLNMMRKEDNSMDVDFEVEDYFKHINGQFNVSAYNDEMSGLPIYRFRFGDDSETEKDRPGNHQPGPPNGRPF